MQRRDFLKSGAALAATAELATGKARGLVHAHNWGNYDFGSGPTVTDRLNQGPFPQYPPDAVIPTDEVVMTTTPSEEVVPNYGKGLITYITADSGTEEIKSDNMPQAIEDLIRFPLGQQLYIRPTWREVQPRPGRLELPDYVKLVFDLAIVGLEIIQLGKLRVVLLRERMVLRLHRVQLAGGQVVLRRHIDALALDRFDHKGGNLAR